MIYQIRVIGSEEALKTFQTRREAEHAAIYESMNGHPVEVIEVNGNSSRVVTLMSNPKPH